MAAPNEELAWPNLGIRLLFNSAAHPIDYAKVLMQIGHEPVPPYATTTLLGRPASCYPNVFQYVAHIYHVDGFTGCFRGLGPKLCANIVSTVTFHRVSIAVAESSPRGDDVKCYEDTEYERLVLFLQDLFRDVCSRTAAVTVSQPFNVIAIRMMAQFVGKETKYTGIFSSIGEIYQTSGVTGFFKGLTPRLIGELISLLLAGTLTYSINRFVVQDLELRTYVSAFMSYFGSAVTYPFVVVANTMAVNNCDLLAGQPPNMPIFTSWVDCWKQLTKTNELKRGGSLIFRYYSTQVVSSHSSDRPMAERKTFFSKN